MTHEHDGWRHRIAATHSVVYRRLCREVYRTELVHFNAADADMLAALVDTLALAPGDMLLDLGCSTGSLTHHLAELTGVEVTGVDHCARCLSYARRSHLNRYPRRRFVVADINGLADAGVGAHDAVMAVDSLYFVRDRDRFAATIARTLRAGGRFAALHTTADEHRWVRAFAAHGLPLEHRDLTELAIATWARLLSALDSRYYDALASDGLEAIARAHRSEGQRVIEQLRQGRLRCLLLAARKGPASSD